MERRTLAEFQAEDDGQVRRVLTCVDDRSRDSRGCGSWCSVDNNVPPIFDVYRVDNDESEHKDEEEQPTDQAASQAEDSQASDTDSEAE